VPETTPEGAGFLPHGLFIDTHSHTDGQLVYAAAGALSTTTERGTWVAPANRVTWTPPGFGHSHRFYGETDVRLVSVPAARCTPIRVARRPRPNWAARPGRAPAH
jgi:quercetin dioxygenase-like cupin family protein